MKQFVLNPEKLNLQNIYFFSLTYFFIAKSKSTLKTKKYLVYKRKKKMQRIIFFSNYNKKTCNTQSVHKSKQQIISYNYFR